MPPEWLEKHSTLLFKCCRRDSALFSKAYNSGAVLLVNHIHIPYVSAQLIS